ncbi:MAG: alpha/beta hydrolase [Ornithinimicrobium sp.]
MEADNRRMIVVISHLGVDLDLDLYPLHSSGRPHPAVLVLPGGGFREHAEHDGQGYAQWLNSIGLQAAVLNYQLLPDPFPLALAQSRAALDALRRGLLMADVDADKVGVIGSSAGGLLAGLLATGVNQLAEGGALPSTRRPDFHIQCYGLADLELIPASAVEALLGDKIGWRDELSPARHVDDATSPTFVWATASDPPGLPNALEGARVLAAHDVPVELHIYPDGWHGVGLAKGVFYGPHGKDLDGRRANPLTDPSSRSGAMLREFAAQIIFRTASNPSLAHGLTRSRRGGIASHRSMCHLGIVIRREHCRSNVGPRYLGSRSKASLMARASAGS